MSDSKFISAYSTMYYFSNDIDNSFPGNGFLKLNTTIPNSATELYIAEIDKFEDSVSLAISTLKAGDTFNIRGVENGIAYTYKLTGTPEEITTAGQPGTNTYYKIGISVEEIIGSRLFKNGESIETVMMFSNSATFIGLIDTPSAYPPASDPKNYMLTVDKQNGSVLFTSTDSIHHPDLTQRDLPDQHPIEAITGLRDELNAVPKQLDDLSDVNAPLPPKDSILTYTGYGWEALMPVASKDEMVSATQGSSPGPLNKILLGYDEISVTESQSGEELYISIDRNALKDEKVALANGSEPLYLENILNAGNSILFEEVGSQLIIHADQTLGETAEWGKISGHIDNQTDLIHRLKSKADINHQHDLSHLTDVDDSSEINGAILVYEKATDTYKLRLYELGNLVDVKITSPIQMGSFLMYGINNAWENVTTDDMAEMFAKANVDAADTPEYLEDKIVAGSNISITKEVNGIYKHLKINADFSGTDEYVAATSSGTPGHLNQVLEGGSHIIITPSLDAERLIIDLKNDISSNIEIRRPLPFIGSSLTTDYIIPGAVENEIAEVLMVTVGGVPQRKQDYAIVTTNVSRDTLRLVNAPEDGTEIVIEYFFILSDLTPPEHVTVNWGDILGNINYQSDLINLLNNKSDIDHVHAIDDLSDVFADSPSENSVLMFFNGMGWLATDASTVMNKVAIDENDTQPDYLLYKLFGDTGIKIEKRGEQVSIGLTDDISSAEWGNITGNIYLQTDLMQEFSKKADLYHNHALKYLLDVSVNNLVDGDILMYYNNVGFVNTNLQEFGYKVKATEYDLNPGFLDGKLVAGNGINLVASTEKITISTDSSGEWGGITGDITTQLDLMTLLNGKSNVGHQHKVEDASNFSWNPVDYALGFMVHSNNGWTTLGHEVFYGKVAVDEHDTTLDFLGNKIIAGNNMEINVVGDDLVIGTTLEASTVEKFPDLLDVPDYAGNAGKLVKVNATEDGVIYGDPSGTTVSWGDISGKMANQTDLQAALDNKSDINHNHDTVYVEVAGDSMTGQLDIADNLHADNIYSRGEITARSIISTGIDANNNSAIQFNYMNGLQGVLWYDNYENNTNNSLKYDPLSNNEGYIMWHSGNFDPSTKENTGHTHVMADITDLFIPSILDELSDVEIVGEVTGEILMYDGVAQKWKNVDLPETGAKTFTELTDTPDTYSGKSGLFVTVNAAESGLEFYDISTIQSDEKVAIGSAFSADYLKNLLEGTNGIIVDIPNTPGDGSKISISGENFSETFIGLTDTPDAYDAGKYLSSENGKIVWKTVSTGGTPEWGTIIGTLSAQTDLYSQLYITAVNNTDTTPSYLENKLDAGDYISMNTVNNNKIVITADLSGLEKVSEGFNTGWRLIGMDPDNYGNIGNGAVDLSIQTLSSSVNGATGNNSFSAGLNNEASGNYSVALGSFVKAQNEGAISFGYSNEATGLYSLATGTVNKAIGVGSTVMGRSHSTATTIVSGEGSFSHQSRIGGTGTKEIAGLGSAVLGGHENATSTSAKYSVVLGGGQQTAIQENMVYVMGAKFWAYTTAERNALSPEAGTIIYNSTTKSVEYYDGSMWVTLYDVSTKTFKALTDTPDSFSNQDGKLVVVNEAGNNLIFTDTIDGGTF